MLVSSASQAEYMARIRGVDRERCLVIPVDVGKRSAMALIADHCHEVVVDPFTFELNETGVSLLLSKAAATPNTLAPVVSGSGLKPPGTITEGWLHDSMLVAETSSR